MTPPLHRDSRVAVLVPHFQCERWLDQCLASLVEQTRAPSAIFVIDDASESPPVAIVRRYPRATLLASDRNVGPYRLIQQVIDETDYDGYMFQDADDWSGPRRLELLLAQAERTGAELIGCQEMRFRPGGQDPAPALYPADPGSVIRMNPRSYVLLHPSSIVSRALVMRLGGFASGLRFGGDAEFQRRALHAAIVSNMDELCYFRRLRPGSLTSAPETAVHSPARKELRRALGRWSMEAFASRDAGRPVDLSPRAVAPPVALRRLAGPPGAPDPSRPGEAHPPFPPPETSRAGEEAPASQAAHRHRRDEAPASQAAHRHRAAAARPVFIIGAPASGIGLLHAALAQSPRFTPTLAGHWLPELLQRPEECDLRDLPRHPWLNERSGEAARGSRWLDGSAAYTLVSARLAELFPNARFVHVLREPSAAVKTLVAASARGARTPDVGEALLDWMQHLATGVRLERFLPSSAVVRVRRDQLMRDSVGELRRLMTFLEERNDDASLVGPSMAIQEATEDSADGGHEGPEDARGFWFMARMMWRDLATADPPTALSTSPPTHLAGPPQGVPDTRPGTPPDPGSHRNGEPLESWLDRLGEEGRTALVIDSTALPWLDGDEEAREVLARRTRLVDYSADTGFLLELRPAHLPPPHSLSP